MITTIPCPNGCPRCVNAEGKDIHLCIDRAADIREYCATLDGQTVGYGYATYHEALSALNERTLDLIEHGLIDTPLAALDAQPASQPCIHCGTVQARASCDACVDWPEAEPVVANPSMWPIRESCTCEMCDAPATVTTTAINGVPLCDSCAAESARVAAELAQMNLRPAGANEAGWYVYLENGNKAWATDPTPAPPPYEPDSEDDNFGGWRVPSADWGAYATGDLTACACGFSATVLLHGVHDTLDIALCYRCHGAYRSMEYPPTITAAAV